MRCGRGVCLFLAVLFLGCHASRGEAAKGDLIPVEAGGRCAATEQIGMQALASAAGAPEGKQLSGAPSDDWIEEKGLALGENRVVYPALREGTLQNALREEINDRILEDGKIRDYVTRMSQLISGGKLEVDWEGAVLGQVFSFAVSAEGAVTGPRPGFAWTAGTVDLRDGHEVALEEIVTDPAAAREAMEAYLESEVAPELSAHLQNSQLTPLPEVFRVSARGLIWYYPLDRLSTLSDRAGAVLIPWLALGDLVNTAEDGILAAMGITEWLRLDSETPAEQQAENAARIRAAAEKGEIPGIPVRLGDRLWDLTEARGMLTDPDVYRMGRMFALEGAEFRNVFLMTDYLSESWEESLVNGIRMDMGNLYGLTVGETAQATWRQVLGAPDHELVLDEEEAESWRTAPGSRDYYEMGGHRLQLQADEAGVLISIILTE